MSTPALATTRGAAADYLELTKPRITAMVAFTTLVGYVCAAPAPLGFGLAAVVLGTALVAAGASVLNMIVERDTDALMVRTERRPLPAARLRTGEALLFGLVVTAAGLAALLWLSGGLAALVALATWASYVFLYTPMKRWTSLSTLVGAVPGALPPVIGWAAARQTLDPGAFVLFAVMFLWQIPHFLAIGWIYREDYARAGFPLLTVLDRAGRLTGRQAVLHSLALLVVSLTPAAAGLAGRVYLAGALTLGIALTAFAVRFAVRRDLPSARQLFLVSVLYLAGLFTLLLAARS